MNLTANLQNSIKKIQKDYSLYFLKILIVIAFIFKTLHLFLFSIPKYLIASDISTHYRWIELIIQDISFIGYDAFYPKGFHLMTAGLTTILSIGTAIAVIAFIFSIVFVFFTYKLAFLFSHDQKIALLTTFFAISISITTKVPGFGFPLPQSIALSLILAAVYFFAKKKFFLAGLILGFHSITHSSWPLSFILILIYFLFTEKITKKNIKQTLYFFAGFLVLFIPYNLINNLFSENNLGGFMVLSEGFLKYSAEWMISPLAFQELTEPNFFIFAGFFGIWLIRKELTRTYLFLLFWFFSVIAVTQYYWFIDLNTLLELGINVPSRVIAFIIFPLAFFSAVALSKVSLNKIVPNADKIKTFLSMTFLILLLLFSVPELERKPDLTQKDFNAIKKLKELPLDSVVFPEDFFKQTNLITLGMKKAPPLRDRALILSGLNPIETKHIDYILVDEGEKYSVYNIEENQGNISWLNQKVQIKEKNFNKTDSLVNYIAAFMVVKRGSIPFSESAFKIIATDSKEMVCFPEKTFISTGEKCTEKKYVVIKGKKADLIELFDSFDDDLFLNKLNYFYREKKIVFEPEPLMKFEDGEIVSLMNYALAHKWTNKQASLSKPNLIIGRLLVSLKILK